MTRRVRRTCGYTGVDRVPHRRSPFATAMRAVALVAFLGRPLLLVALGTPYRAGRAGVKGRRTPAAG
jgi:hypothetical protein